MPLNTAIKKPVLPSLKKYERKENRLCNWMDGQTNVLNLACQ